MKGNLSFKGSEDQHVDLPSTVIILPTTMGKNPDYKNQEKAYQQQKAISGPLISRDVFQSPDISPSRSTTVDKQRSRETSRRLTESDEWGRGAQVGRIEQNALSLMAISSLSGTTLKFVCQYVYILWNGKELCGRSSWATVSSPAKAISWASL